jgi:hypothetical protein
VDLIRVATVESPLTDRSAAPKQGDEGAPEATLVFEVGFATALEGLAAGDEILLLTWLDRASRDVLRVHPRGEEERPEQGVFATRSPDRPNPIGLQLCWGSTARVCASAGSRRSTARPSSTSSPCWALWPSAEGNSYRVGRLYPR